MKREKYTHFSPMTDCSKAPEFPECIYFLLRPKTNIGMKIDIVNIVKCHCQLVLSALSERPPCLPCCLPAAYLLSFSPLWASSYGIRLCSRVYYMLQIDNVVTIIVANVQLLVVAAKNRLENL
uniref:Uncharacterized protein n=1 Tax=Glossina pallidipes TaxID=7398 RepID=A0A1A9ZIR8_GLOPL